MQQPLRSSCHSPLRGPHHPSAWWAASGSHHWPSLTGLPGSPSAAACQFIYKCEAVIAVQVAKWTVQIESYSSETLYCKIRFLQKMFSTMQCPWSSPVCELLMRGRKDVVLSKPWTLNPIYLGVTFTSALLVPWTSPGCFEGFRLWKSQPEQVVLLWACPALARPPTMPLKHLPSSQKSCLPLDNAVFDSLKLFLFAYTPERGLLAFMRMWSNGEPLLIERLQIPKRAMSPEQETFSHTS